ncbi:BTB/POZ and MATH domain-containing protein 2-like [Lolium rigidum]|uniref:BTB/POZ and MATH domain-containing protein 2-like n=1 Tax=Lolium rigidum TaxID=89674 RepID=UPI001F5C34B9|nr:BTB/POZ and MATH domain-containing protein 2-like [Lolium rigidum]
MRTASTCYPSAVRGTHTFKITGYNLHRALGAGKGKPLQSATFDVGGYLWCLKYIPEWMFEEEDNTDLAFILLHLVTDDAEARALVEFRMLDPANKLPPSVVLSKKRLSVYKRGPALGTLLQPSTYLRDDNLVIECDITVLKESMVTAATFDISVPPSDLAEYFKELLEKEEEADVVFKVKDEVFPAHKIVIAARSPVFKAELFGPMSDMTRRNITIEDMQPAVFKALLYFIYTDSLPSMENLEGDDGKEMGKHLLVAADRYAMERMKVMCESNLCKSLDVENVTGALALADRHHCSELKNACLEFIASPDRMDDVMASQGYAHLKRSCPAVVIDVFERAKKSRGI